MKSLKKLNLNNNKLLEINNLKISNLTRLNIDCNSIKNLN